jgi:hypothetical protein
VGGAIANVGRSLKLADDQFSGNTRTQSGGAIGISSGTLFMSGCSVSGNQAESSNGGGPYVGGGAVMIENSTFERNSAQDDGAIVDFGGSLKLINSKLASNTAVEGVAAASLSMAAHRRICSIAPSRTTRIRPK